MWIKSLLALICLISINCHAMTCNLKDTNKYDYVRFKPFGNGWLAIRGMEGIAYIPDPNNTAQQYMKCEDK